jgi:hypothetical protein
MLDIIVESPLYQEIQLDGRKTESHRFLLKLLKERFGEIDEELAENVKDLSTEQAEELGVKLFKIETIEEFKRLLAESTPLN